MHLNYTISCNSVKPSARPHDPVRVTEASASTPHSCFKHVVVAFYLLFDILGIMKSNEAIDSLGALASEARLAVFRLLVKRGPSGYTPSELVERLGVPAPTLSFHLKALVNAGLVVSRRESRNLYYRPDFERMRALVGFLTDNCCSLADEACDANCEPLQAAPSKRKRA